MKISANFWLAKQTPVQASIRNGINRQILTRILPEFVCAAHQLNKDRSLLNAPVEIVIPVTFSSQSKPSSFVTSILRLKEGRENHGMMETTSAGTTPGPKAHVGFNRSSIRSEVLIQLIVGEFLIYFVYSCLAFDGEKELQLATSILKSVKTTHSRIEEVRHAIMRMTIKGGRRSSNSSEKLIGADETNDREHLRADLDSLVYSISALKSEIWENTNSFQCLRSLMLNVNSSACCNRALCKTWLSDETEGQRDQVSTTVSMNDMTDDEQIDESWSPAWHQIRQCRRPNLLNSIIPANHHGSSHESSACKMSSHVTIVVRNDKHICWSIKIPNWLGRCGDDPIIIPSQDCSMMNFLISQDFYRFVKSKKTTVNNSRPSLYCLRGLELESSRVKADEKGGGGGGGSATTTTTTTTSNTHPSSPTTFGDTQDIILDEDLLCFKALERLRDIDNKYICCMINNEIGRLVESSAHSPSTISRRRNNSFEQYMNFWCVYFALDLEGMTRLCSENNLFGVSNFTEVSIDYVKQMESESRLYRVLNRHRQLGLTPRPFTTNRAPTTTTTTTRADTTTTTTTTTSLSGPPPLPPLSNVTIEQEIANFAHHTMCCSDYYLPRLSAQIGCFLYKGLMCARNISIHTNQYESFRNKFCGQPDIIYGFLKTKIRIKSHQILLIRTPEYSKCLSFLATLFLKPSSCSLDLWLRYHRGGGGGGGGGARSAGCDVRASSSEGRPRPSPSNSSTDGSDFYESLQIDSCVLTGTLEFYLNVFLQHQITKQDPDDELILLICKFLWLYKITNKNLALELRHIMSALRKCFSDNQRIIKIIEYLILKKFQETCIISYLIYEPPSNKPPQNAAGRNPRQTQHLNHQPQVPNLPYPKPQDLGPSDLSHTTPPSLDLMKKPTIPQPAVLVNMFVNYIRKYGRIGSRRIQLEKITRLINSTLIQMKTTMKINETSNTPMIVPQTFHENVITACCDVLREYIIPHLDMIHAAAGFCEIKKSILALEQDVVRLKNEQCDHPSVDQSVDPDFRELVRLVSSVDLDNLKDLGDKVYQVAKVGASYELLKKTVLSMARFIDKRLATALQGFITSITLLPAVYTQILIALILQYIQKLDESLDGMTEAPKNKKSHNTTRAHEIIIPPEIADQLKGLSKYFKEILNTHLSFEEKNSSFVTEGLKTIKSIVLDAIEGCRHIHRTKKQKSSSLSMFFKVMDTQLLINVCIENGYKQRAIMLCEEYLSGDHGNVSFYSQFPATYYKTFKTNRNPDINIYDCGDEVSIGVWEISTYLIDSSTALAQERWQNEVDNYCDSITERLKVVAKPENHTSEVYEVESSRLTQLCGTLCAEDVLRLNDWSGITCIWDTVLLLPLKYLCQQARSCEIEGHNQLNQNFSLLALPQTCLEISADPAAYDLGDRHYLCSVCELCKICDCFCPIQTRCSFSQGGGHTNTGSRSLRVKGQLGLINALGILGHSAAIGESLEPLRLDLLKNRFNSHTLVHQWVVAFEKREEKPGLLDNLVKDLAETFEDFRGLGELEINETRTHLICEQDIDCENQFLEISELALNLRRPPDKVENVDNSYYDSIEMIRCFPNHQVFRLQFAHQLFELIHEELYDRTVVERTGCEKPLDLMDQPLNSITRMSLSEMMLRCMEEYLVCATLDDEASMTCILRWLCLLCAIPSCDNSGGNTQVIDGLFAVKNELANRFAVAHIELIANVPVRVWFRILPQLVCRSTLLTVGQLVFVPLIARLLIVCPHQTLWYLAQLWASTRLRYRGASEAILASTHRLLTQQTDPLEIALAQKIEFAPRKADISTIKTMWINMKKWTELLTQAAEDTRIPPGECALKSIYPALASFKLDTILMPIKKTLWVTQQTNSPTILQRWKEKYSKLRCTTLASVFQSPSLTIPGLSLPICCVENYEIPTPLVWMRGLNNRVVVYRSKQRPKRICSIGDDGCLYHFLLKFEGTGDLRKDARVEEIVNSTNENLPPNISTRSITFIVLCLKELSGIIEWVCGVSVLKDCLKDASLSASGKNTECDQKLRFTARPKQSEYGQVLKNYIELGLMKYPPVLHRWFLTEFGDSSSHWLTARTHFVESLAIWNCIGYVMGLGDRHSENILISSLTGHITHVDFDCLFDKGQIKLTIPEVVPFRMTPNIVTACGSSYKLLRKNMIDVMNLSLKNRSVDFQAILHTFVSDPAVEWSNKKDIQVLNHVQWKIQGKLNHSCHFTKLAKQNPKGDRYKLATKVPRPATLPVWSHRRLPTEVFVDLLLECACDKLNLALMYFGWSAWL